MDSIFIYLAVSGGVAVSIVLPILRAMLPKPPEASTLSKTAEKANAFWTLIKPYVITGIFSLIVALILVAFLGDTIDSWQKGFLAGYTADSTLQKIAPPQGKAS